MWALRKLMHNEFSLPKISRILLSLHWARQRYEHPRNPSLSLSIIRNTYYNIYIIHIIYIYNIYIYIYNRHIHIYIYNNYTHIYIYIINYYNCLNLLFWVERVGSHVRFTCYGATGATATRSTEAVPLDTFESWDPDLGCREGMIQGFLIQGTISTYVYSDTFVYIYI